MEKLEFLIAILSALSAIVALVLKLWQVFSSLINEKKYSELFDIVAKAVIEAEQIYSLSGEEKKERVMDAVAKAAEELDVKEFDAERISYLIDSIIEITKKVNVK